MLFYPFRQDALMNSDYSANTTRGVPQKRLIEIPFRGLGYNENIKQGGNW